MISTTETETPVWVFTVLSGIPLPPSSCAIQVGSYTEDTGLVPDASASDSVTSQAMTIP